MGIASSQWDPSQKFRPAKGKSTAVKRISKERLDIFRKQLQQAEADRIDRSTTQQLNTTQKVVVPNEQTPKLQPALFSHFATNGIPVSEEPARPIAFVSRYLSNEPPPARPEPLPVKPESTADATDGVPFADSLSADTLGESPSSSQAPVQTGSSPGYLTNAPSSVPERSLAEQMRMYKEDQLLAHPGGDYMDLSLDDPRKSTVNHNNFFERIGKDLKDALANIGNFFKDLTIGSEYRYIDENGNVATAKRRGLLGNILEFFKDMASGLSFGYFRPDGEPEPANFGERLKFVYEKCFNEAIMGDIVLGVPSSAVNMIDDAALAVWNALEVIPDATIGNIPAGRQAVTSLFDNGQVVIDYITDCLPTGEAWMRVHAYKLSLDEFSPPLYYNFTLPERFGEDARWSTVRNTPFRKAIETVGSLLADIGMAYVASYGVRTSSEKR